MLLGKRGNKRGQLTIFIILGLLFLIVLIVLFSRGNVGTFFVSKTPFQEVEECAKVSVQESIDILSLQGGSIEPENYYLYEGNQIEYLCYTEENLKNCVTQKPILKTSIEDEIKSYVDPKIRSCLNSLTESLEDRGYSVSMKNPVIDIEIIADNILVDMDIDLRITKDGTESYSNVRTGVKSKIYNFVIIASSIMNWETNFGDSETLNYMLYYPSLKVEKKKQGDGTKIYILTDRESEEKFMFAIRSFAIPPGVIEL